MLEHHLQKQILKELVVRECARFAELKPANVDGNIFTYHLRRLIKAHYIEKNADGQYSLTASGKRLGISSDLSAQDILEEAHPVLLLAVRKGDAWLLRRRLAHPMIGTYGFVHGEPLLREDVCDTAATVLLQKTGLSARFEPRGCGYVRIFKNGEQESFVQFTLLEAHDIEGELIPALRNGENAWVKQPDFAADDMVPSMAALAAKIDEPGFFFAELSYEL